MIAEEIRVGESYLWDVHAGRPVVVKVLGIAEPRTEWMHGAPTYNVRNSKGREFPLFGYQLKPLPEELRPLAPLVGIIGRKRAGKDTVAGQLISEFGVQRLAFADRLRRVLYGVNPILHRYEYHTGGHRTLRVQDLVDARGWEVAKDNPEVRRLLQEIGTVYRNEVDQDAWVTPVLAEADQLRRQGVPVVITDVRFPNEAEAVKAAGGKLVRVYRPGQLEDAASLHISETALDECLVDYGIVNDGDLEYLLDRASEFGRWLELDSVQLAEVG